MLGNGKLDRAEGLPHRERADGGVGVGDGGRVGLQLGVEGLSGDEGVGVGGEEGGDLRGG